MKQRDKGPYLRIRWYCRDGAVLPPTPYACSKRGGGEQHASYTDDADRLQALGFDVGTILVALPYEQFEDARRGHYRLRELVLEDYLVDNDDGWVLRGARYYRGARQIESEERYGRRHLVRLLSDPAWRRDNPLLATPLVAAVPHGQPGVPGDRIRELATQMARLNPELMDLRIKIHSSPGPDDLDAVRAAANSAQRRSSMMRRTLAELQDQLQTLYSADLDEHRWASLASELDELDRTDLTAEMRAAAAAIRGGTVRQQVAELSRLLLAARRGYNQLGSGSRAGAQALHVLDLINYGDALLRSASNSWLASRRTPSGGRASRAEYLAFVENLTDAAYGSGWLTEREYVALRAQPSGRDLPAEDYRKRVEYLGNAVLWGQAALRQTYGEPLLRYRQVEPAARGFEDGMLRGSVLLALSNVIDDLSRDASLAAGVRHSVFDAPPPGRVMALNTGVARGRLYVVDDERDLGRLDPRGIYVLPKTVLDLGRVAGILTLDEGSRLSHIQLLARSLGIPNAAISAQLLPQLRAYAGREVFFSVGQDGGVVVGRGDDLRTVDAELLRQRSQQPAAGIAIDADRLDLDEQRLFTLDEVGPEDSGRIIGPKAANLAKLRSFFPDRVEQGLVIPFGVFRAHIERDLLNTGRSLFTELRATYLAVEGEQRRGYSEEEAHARLLQRLRVIQRTIRAMPLLPDFERRLRAALHEHFGPDGTYGVFVRSDTNVEDLPNFTGAGLNLTVMNRISVDGIIDGIRDVWASPFSERSYTWRQQLVTTPEHVYPSILLLRSVPAEASGVLATTDLVEKRAGWWTITASEGVGGVVEGEPAETILVPGATAGAGESVLVSSARAVWRKILVTSGAGGIDRVPVQGNARLLTEPRIDDLRRLVDEIDARYPKAFDESGSSLPWDIEFGFVDDKTYLFQIRPLVGDPATVGSSAVTTVSWSGEHPDRSGVISLDEPPQMRR